MSENNSLVVQEPTDAGAVMVQTAQWGDFTLEMVKSKKAPESAEFLPAKVLKVGQILWSFKSNHPGYHGLAKLMEHGEELVIVLCTKTELHAVVPVTDTSHHFGQMPDGSFMGGRSIKDVITLKSEIAKLMHLEPIWTEREEKMRTAMQRQRAEAIAHASAKHEAEAEARRTAVRAERDAKRTALLARKRAYAFTAGGERRHGIPVIGDEWAVLPGDTFCITVDSYAVDTGKHGNVLECFITKKSPSGRIDRDKVTPVFERDPRAVKKEVASLLTTKVMKLKGELEEVIVANNMDDVRNLNKGGLNSGTLVLVDDGKDTMNVYRLLGGEVTTYTHVRRMTPQ